VRRLRERLHEAGANGGAPGDVLRADPRAMPEAIASLKSQATAGASVLLRDRENDQYERTPEGTILKEVSFSMSWETNISNQGVIFEAEHCIDTGQPGVEGPDRQDSIRRPFRAASERDADRASDFGDG